MKTFLKGLGLALGLSVAGSASAATWFNTPQILPDVRAPQIQFSANGSTFGAVYELGKELNVAYSTSTPKFGFSLDSHLDESSLGYAFTIKNFTAQTQAVSLTFAIPVQLQNLASASFTSSYSASLTSFAGQPLSLGALDPSGAIQVTQLLGTGLGFGLGESLTNPAGGSTTSGFFEGTTTLQQPTLLDWALLTTTLNFELSGNSSFAAFSGRTEWAAGPADTPVVTPLPAALPLLLGGLGLVGIAARRKRH